jgi:site-specific DNA recombinase
MSINPIKQVNSIYGYVRVSTKEQVKSGISLETQKKNIEEFVRSKYNRGVDEWFIDDGVSGLSPILERPASKDLTDTMDEFDVVVCTRLDRLSRSTNDLLNMIPNFEGCGITLFFCEQFGEMPIVYPKPASEKGLRSRFDMAEMANKIMLMVLSAVAEIEHSTIKDRFGDGKIDWASRGYSIGGSVPFGYRKVREKHGNKMRSKLIEDEEEQKILKTIRRLHKRGLGCRKIANQINSLYKDVNMNYNKVDRILNRKYQGLSSAA